MDIEKIAQKMLEAAPEGAPIVDENGKAVSAIAIVVSEASTVMKARTTPYGIGNALLSLFDSIPKEMKTMIQMEMYKLLPKEMQQIVILGMIALDSGIKNLPKPE